MNIQDWSRARSQYDDCNRPGAARRYPHRRRPAPPDRRFRDARRSARLCGEGQARAQFPRRPRHARPALIRSRELRADSLAAARRFVTLGIKPGDRVALVAETGAEFAAAFFGAVYAGAWPVPLPLPTSFGGREAYVEQLKVMLTAATRRCSSTRPSLPPSLPMPPPQLGVPARDWDTLSDVAEAQGRASDVRPRRNRLSAIFERLDPLPARGRRHPSRPARQSALARRRAGARGRRPGRVVAALVP